MTSVLPRSLGEAWLGRKPSLMGAGVALEVAVTLSRAICFQEERI